MNTLVLGGNHLPVIHSLTIFGMTYQTNLNRFFLINLT